MSTMITSIDFVESLERDRPARAPLTPQARLKRDAIAIVSQRLLDESPGEEHPRIELARGILLSDALIVTKGEPPFVRDGNDEWVIENDRCTCPAHAEAPSRVCPHRYAFRLYKRAQLWAKEQGGHPSAATHSPTGSEAPFSVNVSETIGRRYMQITCRTDDPTVLHGLLMDANSMLDTLMALRQGELKRDPEPVPEPAPAPISRPQDSRFVEPPPSQPGNRPKQWVAPDPDAPTCKVHVGRPMRHSNFQNKPGFIIWMCSADDPGKKNDKCEYKVWERLAVVKGEDGG